MGIENNAYRRVLNSYWPERKKDFPHRVEDKLHVIPGLYEGEGADEFIVRLQEELDVTVHTLGNSEGAG
jgi:hypothetical protein